MTIRVECENCGEEYQVSDDKAGRMLTCRACGEKTEVPMPRRSRGGESSGRDGGRRATPPRREQSRDGRRPARGGSKPAINPAVAGGIGGGVVVLLIAGWFLFGGGGDDPQPVPPQIADNGAANPGTASNLGTGPTGMPAQTGGANVPAASSGAGGTPPGIPADVQARIDEARAQLGQVTGGTNTTSSSSASGIRSNTAGAQPAVSEPLDPNNATVWTIDNPLTGSGRLSIQANALRPLKWDYQPDGVPAVETSDRPVSLPVQRGSEVWFPPTPSSLVALGKLPGQFELWDLADLKQRATVKIDSFFSRGMTLSPDATLLATINSDPKSGYRIVVHRLDGSVVQTIHSDQQMTSGIYEFVSNEQLLATHLTTGGQRASRGEEAIHVFSVESGEPLHAVDFGGINPQTLRLSPGRKYAAAINKDKHLVLCELATGRRVAEVALPDSDSNNWITQVKAAGFSNDGREFAAVLGNTVNFLLNWDLTTGRLTHNHTLKEAILNPTGYLRDRMAMEFAADGSGWVAGGESFIDRETGIVRWLATRETGFGNGYPRRLLSGNRVLGIHGEGRTPLEPLALNYADLNNLLAPVKPDSIRRLEAVSSSLPAGRAPRSTARATVLPNDAAAWSGSAVAAVPAADAKSSDVPLGSQGVKAHFANDSRAVAFDKVEARELPTVFKNYPGLKVLRTVSLTNGSTISEVPAPDETEVIALSPSGEVALTRRAKTEIIDVWNTSEGRHVVAANLIDDPGHATLGNSLRIWLADDDTLLMYQAPFGNQRTPTLGCWSLSTLSQKYALELKPRKVPTRSTFGANETDAAITPMTIDAAGKVMALADGDRIRMLDVATGQVLGDLPIGNFSHADAFPLLPNVGSFSPDGQQFAAMLGGRQQAILARWDLNDGALIEQFTIPSASFYLVNTLVWTHPELLLTRTLRGDWLAIDLNRHCSVWQFTAVDHITAAGQVQTRQADWSAGTTRLSSQPLPWDDVKTEVAKLMPSERVVLSSQTPASVKLVQSQYTGGVDGSFPQQVTGALTQGLQKVGAKVDPSAALTLRTSMTSDGTKNEERRYSGSGGQQNFTFAISYYTLAMELVDADGTVLWKTGTVASNSPPFFSITNQNANLQAELTKQGNDSLKNAITSFFTQFALPDPLYYQPTSNSGTVAALGTTSLKPEATSTVAASGSRPGSVPNGVSAAALPDEPPNETDFIAQCRSVVNQAYGDVLKTDPAKWKSQLQWSSALQRPVVAVRWGLAVQFAKTPDGAEIRVQPPTRGMLAQLGTASAGSGPKLVDAMDAMLRSGVLGTWPPSDHPLTTGTILLGAGSQADILTGARNARLDFVVIAYFGRSRVGRDMVNTLEFRVLDVSTGNKLFASDALKESDLADTAVDLGAETAAKLSTWIRENIAPQPIGEILAAAVSARLKHLTETESFHPLADLLEVRFYLAENLTTEASALRAATKIILRDDDAKAIVSGSNDERAAAVQAIIER